MWILLTVKLPTEISPPKYSIHWAGASAEDVQKSLEQKKRTDVEGLVYGTLMDMGDKYAGHFGYEPKEAGSVWIVFDNVPIKAWPHEYVTLDSENMTMYLEGTTQDELSMSHVPMYGREPLFCDPITCKFIENGFERHPEFSRESFEAALLDGAHELTAFYTSLGRIPRNLWFSIVKPYADVYGITERDLEPKYQKQDIMAKIKSGWEE